MDINDLISTSQEKLRNMNTAGGQAIGCLKAMILLNTMPPVHAEQAKRIIAEWETASAYFTSLEKV